LSRKNLHFRDCSDALVALLISNGSDFIRPRLQRLQNLLEGVNPDFVNSCNSNQKGFKFMSIYADTYNRFAEKVTVIFILII
jgi:hypothetical protein